MLSPDITVWECADLMALQVLYIESTQGDTLKDTCTIGEYETQKQKNFTFNLHKVFK